MNAAVPAALLAAEGGCFHCGTAIAPSLRGRWQVEIDGGARAMCCAGCEAVAQAIADLGQLDYYRNRTGPAVTAAQDVLPAELALYDDERQAARFVREGDDCEASFTVEGIRCAACVWLIEKRLARVPGVLKAELNVASERLFVRWDKSQCRPSAIVAAAREVGYAAYPYEAARHGEQLRRRAKTLSRQLFVAGLAMMQVMMYAWPAYVADDGTLDADMDGLMRWASLLLTLPVVLYSARPFFAGAWTSLKARVAGMDLPVALGIAAGFGGSVAATVRGEGLVYFDSVTMFVFLLLCSRYLELSARIRAAEAGERLHHALPASATRLPGYPYDRMPETVPAAALRAGDAVLVASGEAVPADGVVLEGTSALDLSLLTGESAPQPRGRGDDLPGGAINSGAPLLVRIARAAADSTLAGLVRLVEQAGESRPRVALWADRVGAWFVAGLLLLAAAVLLAWQAVDPARAWPIAVAVLVVSCPCALSLATPTVLAAATDRLLGRGVLVTRGHALETLARATHVVFDKTGTLTEGRPVLRAVQPLAALDAAACARLAAALARASAHPASRALAGTAGAPEAAGVVETAGRGLEGMVEGRRYRLGNAAFVAELAGEFADEAGEGTRLYLGASGGVLARFELEDALRADAREVVDAFRRMGKTVVLLSGDAESVTRQVAARLGIDEASGACLPEEKLRRVRALQAQGAVVAMIGDGINDAAAIGAADVSFAMRAGAALAHAHADAVLLSPRLSAFAECAATADKAMRLVRQNLAWAMVYNVVAIPAAALGLLSPLLSGAGMAASSAIVVANALRARRA